MSEADAPSSIMQARILLIDDDSELAAMLAQFLRNEGLDTRIAGDGQTAMGQLTEADPDLVILDVMLPGRSGFDLLRDIRARSPRLPVIMLTARGEPIDRILGLELGADDYLPKPFDPRELLARIRAILRRAAATPTDVTGKAEADAVLQYGALRLETRRRRVTLDGQTLELTAAEFKVLQCLLESAGQPVERQQLTEQALGRKLTLYDRAIDTHVSNLRRKMERLRGTGIEIRAVRGTGYELIDTSMI